MLFRSLSRQKWEYEIERTGYSDLLAMGTADMDYRAPEPILRSLRNVLDRGHLGYPYLTDDYFRAIEDWLMRATSWKIKARSSVANSVGVYMSAWTAISLLTVPGDRIAILTPVHFCFKKMISMNNRAVVECPLSLKGNRYEVDYAHLDACLKSNVKILWLCNPHNPVGRVWSKEELEIIGSLCIKNNVLIISDDVYCGLLFPGISYTPIASLSNEISRHTITLYSTSKSYNTTGLRHSFVVTENLEMFLGYEEALARCDLDYGVNIMGTAATIAAFNECDPWLSQLMQGIETHHSYITHYIAEYMPTLQVVQSEGTYFAWIDMRSMGLDSQKLSFLIEQEEHLIVENGLHQGKGGGGFIRMNLATSKQNIEEGVRRLRAFWERRQARTN